MSNLTKTWKTIIIDDEALARKRLSALLTDFPYIELIAEARDGFEALEVIHQLHPELIFLDIQMPGLSGFEMLEQLSEHPLIIFTTAFDQYALKAFEEYAIDYLLKPIEKKRLERALNKLHYLSGADREVWQSQLTSLLDSLRKPRVNRYPVKVGDRVLFIDYDDIYYFQATDKVVVLHTYDKTYVCGDSLNVLAEKLPGDMFVRAHRSILVNTKHVKEARRWFAGKYRLIMSDKNRSELPLSGKQRKYFGF